jgi:hypothetical protein
MGNWASWLAWLKPTIPIVATTPIATINPPSNLPREGRVKRSLPAWLAILDSKVEIMSKSMRLLH